MSMTRAKLLKATAHAICMNSPLPSDEPMLKSEEQDVFKFTIFVPSDNYRYNGPSVALNEKLIINFGDGQTGEIIDSGIFIIHDYNKAGAYQITIKGNLMSIAFWKGGYDETLYSIDTKFPKSMKQKLDFFGLFHGCLNLHSIPSGLFDNCTEATTFDQCFFDCHSLISIPDGLFEKCTKAVNFGNCFRDCSSLTSIPSGLFEKCTKAVNFASCFASCSSLTSIPDGLFDDMSNSTRFDACFGACTSLTYIPFELFNDCVNANNFYQCFVRCNSVISRVPELWNTHPNASHSLCYTGCTNAANYSDIPLDWR